ncbi:MAG: ATP-binding protein [Candidatus Promineifilaceae bacterium]
MAIDNPLPAGALTFLFTDIEKSTFLWDRHGEGMRTTLSQHDLLLRTIIQQHDGRVVKTTGDGLLAVFVAPAMAILAALDAQVALAAEAWKEIAPDTIRVRMGLHSGEAELRDGDYYGTAVNRAARIMDLGHGGQVLLSATTADLLKDMVLPQINLRDLGDHLLRGLSGNERIYQVLAPGLNSDFPPLRSGGALAGNLPAHVSSFIGRAREMAEVRNALPHTRLLTLTGPGGTGKTRLSLQVAHDVQAEFKHGAWIVELAPLTDPALVIPAAANAFGLSGQTGDQTRQMLFSYLREKELLLVLDNCEHLIEACARLASDLVAACPRLTILASSREGLGVYGETTYHLPTLTLPSGNGETAESAARSESVQLFVERATAAQPGFRLDDFNAAAVSQVVRRLDGIPLAIELAAARLKFFNIEQIAERLDDRFRLLTGGSRTALPRQQTLRALIDWSYDLLDEDERDLFRRLSVFIGGWTLDAAESIASQLDIYTLLPQLASKSLVQRATASQEEEGLPAPEPRYYYLETIRQYARDRLAESGQVEEARDRHFAFYEQVAQSFTTSSSPRRTVLRSSIVFQEQDNLRAAAEWAIERYPERLLNLLWNVSLFAADQLPGSEFINWIESALLNLDAQPPLLGEAALARDEARLRGMTTLGLLKVFLGQLAEAYALGQEVSEQLRQQENVDPLLLSAALFVKAQSGYFIKAPELEETVTETLNTLERARNHPASSAFRAMGLMIAAETAAREGDLETAEKYFVESTDLLENTSPEFLPWAEYSRLLMMEQMGFEDELVREQLHKTVAVLRQIRSRRLVAMTESDWAHRMRRQGNFEEAMAIYRRVLVVWRDLGHRAAVANIFENIAFIDRAQGRSGRAATLFGAAEQIREVIGQDMLPVEREEYDREVNALREMLGEQETARLWARGRTLSTDDLLALVTENE